MHSRTSARPQKHSSHVTLTSPVLQASHGNGYVPSKSYGYVPGGRPAPEPPTVLGPEKNFWKFARGNSLTDEVTETWVDALARSYHNPNVFVREALGITPEDWQARAMDAVAKHDRVSIRSGHGIGKTALQSWLVWWFLCTRLRCKVPVSANSQDQLRDTIWPEIARWHHKLPEELLTSCSRQNKHR